MVVTALILERDVSIFVGQAKYDAWAKLRGVAKDAAMQQYIDLVERLKTGG